MARQAIKAAHPKLQLRVACGKLLVPNWRPNGGHDDGGASMSGH